MAYCTGQPNGLQDCYPQDYGVMPMEGDVTHMAPEISMFLVDTSNSLHMYSAYYSIGLGVSDAVNLKHCIYNLCIIVYIYFTCTIMICAFY